LLAGIFKVTGVWEMGAFALAVAGSLALILACYIIARKAGVPAVVNAVLLVGMVVCVALVPLSISGMESTAQTAVDVIFLYLACGLAWESETSRGRWDWRSAVVIFLAAMVTAIRFEGLFLAAIIGALFLFRRRVGMGIAVGVGAFLPVVVHGVVSKAHGGFWLPNSVLVKGIPPSLANLHDVLRTFGFRSAHALQLAPWVSGLVIGALLIALFFPGGGEKSWRNLQRSLLVVPAVTAIVHAQYAATGAFYRYEAYLIAMLLLPIGTTLFGVGGGVGSTTIKNFRPAWRVACLLPVIFAVACAARRSEEAFAMTPVACGNIRDQQCEMAAFVRKYYDGQGIAANDIGAISFFTRVHLLDTFGLASLEVTRLKLSGGFDTAAVERLAREHHVKIAIVYDSWFRPFGGAPRSWRKAGRWVMENNFICFEPEVSFYAIDAAEEARLRECLAEFSAKLPGNVLFVPAR